MKHTQIVTSAEPVGLLSLSPGSIWPGCEMLIICYTSLLWALTSSFGQIKT